MNCTHYLQGKCDLGEQQCIADYGVFCPNFTEKEKE